MAYQPLWVIQYQILFMNILDIYDLFVSLFLMAYQPFEAI